ncbi:MAG: ATP-binding protein [Desulfovermiculus sp.]
MYDTSTALLEKIRLGEDSFLELKEVRIAGSRVRAPRRDSLADELAAFANAKGGVCVLGVDDATHEVLGIPVNKLDLVTDFVRQTCLDSVIPPLTPVIERLKLPTTTGEEVAVIKVEVGRSLWVHKSPGGYLHRVGDQKREMSPDYLARLFQQRSQIRLIRFDEQPVPNATLEDLDSSLCQRFATPRTRDSRKDLLRKLGITAWDDDVLRPTVAGILMGTEDPRKWLPNAFIQAVAYRGTMIRPAEDANYQLDAADITGPLDQQVMTACRFVKRNMKVAARKKTGRQDIPQFDLTAVFEAVVNAVAHRDYAMQGAKIRLRMFADRLELYSPGPIPNTMTVDSLPYRQSARNETITTLLAKCRVPDEDGLETGRTTMMDKRGEGVSIILETSQRLSGRIPEYRLIDDSELLLIIYAAGLQNEEMS